MIEIWLKFEGRKSLNLAQKVAQSDKRIIFDGFLREIEVEIFLLNLFLPDFFLIQILANFLHFYKMFLRTQENLLKNFQPSPKHPQIYHLLPELTELITFDLNMPSSLSF
jgi:hypothetical protein